MGLRAADMAAKWITWLAANGLPATYHHADGSAEGVTRSIQVEFEDRDAAPEDFEGGRRLVHRGVVRLSDSEASGVPEARMKSTDWITIKGQDWSLDGDGRNEGAGLIEVNVKRSELLQRIAR